MGSGFEVMSNAVVYRKRSVKNSTLIKALLFLAPAAIMVLVFIYYPILKTVSLAFTNYKLYDQGNIGFNGLDNFREILRDRRLPMILRNTVAWVSFSLFFQFTIGFGIALLLRKKFRGMGIYQGIIFIPWALSGFLMGLVWKWIFDDNLGIMNDMLLKLGIIDQRLPWLSNAKFAMVAVIIANVWYGVTFFVIMILAALQGVPHEILEASELDGCNKFQQLFQVIVPYIRSTLVLIILLRIMWITNFPDIIFGMTSGGPIGGTHILSSWLVEKITYDQDWGVGSAIGLMILGILFIFTIFYLMASRLEKDSGV